MIELADKYIKTIRTVFRMFKKLNTDIFMQIKLLVMKTAMSKMKN